MWSFLQSWILWIEEIRYSSLGFLMQLQSDWSWNWNIQWLDVCGGGMSLCGLKAFIYSPSIWKFGLLSASSQLDSPHAINSFYMASEVLKFYHKIWCSFSLVYGNTCDKTPCHIISFSVEFYWSKQSQKYMLFQGEGTYTNRYLNKRSVKKVCRHILKRSWCSFHSFLYFSLKKCNQVLPLKPTNKLQPHTQSVWLPN